MQARPLALRTSGLLRFFGVRGSAGPVSDAISARFGCRAILAPLRSIYPSEKRAPHSSQLAQHPEIAAKKLLSQSRLLVRIHLVSG